MSSKTVKVKVPGTTANCGPGFDVMGIACSIYNELELTLLEENKLIIEIYGDGAENIPKDSKNMVWRCIKQLLDKAGANYKGAHIKMTNNVPLSRGLGSSATAIVAGLVAANACLDNKYSVQEIFEMATKIEGHPDNVAPALFGGITISAFLDGKLKHISFVPEFPLKMVVAIPDFYLSTKKARSVLKQNVPLKDAIFNIGHIAMIIGAFSQSKPDILKGAFDDRLHQPYRADLIPGMYDVFEAADKNGALGTVLSGAGPTLIAYTAENGEAIGQAMVQAFAKHDVKARYLVLDIDREGAKII
ncbi:homoserine kinase [Megamonas hypermegale]|uniref:Homoserine kinase n=1 Tax=Megamonas hypermegale TaxID=158847 RepID=A0A921HP78_9FIRM|nr:homoserine kinase [Megamonas hypermegale]MDM8144164.1 homoserine kinase [Megamonas hypermegale]HJF85194.1 homoserine kinase [Megamonas hypermegale]